MSTHPHLEARVSAQERRQLNLEAYVEELSSNLTTSIKQLSDDMTASFRQLATYQTQTEKQIDTRFNQVETRIDRLETTLSEHTVLLTQILERLPKQ